MGYDEIIPKLGDFGTYQKRIYFLLCLPAILCAFHKLGNVFLIAEPDHRCVLPGEPENASFALDKDIFDAKIPWDPLLKKHSSCLYFDEQNRTKKCDKYIFDDSLYGETAVIELNLTCDRAHLIATGNAIFMFGVMVGSIVFGELSDRYGRKIIFFISLVVQVVCGTAAAFAPDFWSFTILRFLVGATTSGVFLVAYVIALEMVGPSSRTLAGTVMQMFFSLGYMLTALLAIQVPEWRHLQLTLTLPGTVFLVYWFIVPESSRWLLTKNRVSEVKVQVKQVAKVNKVEISDEFLDLHLVPEQKSNDSNIVKKATILDIFKYKNLRTRALIIFFDWFANNITYYGLSWNTNNLAGDPYLNFVISGAVEIPAYLFVQLTLNRWGRKPVMCGCMILAGIALLLTAIPGLPHWLIIVLAMIGKLSITSSYGAVYIFSTEQFPTVIRNAGLGAGSTCARLGSIVAPYINIMSKIWTPFPLIVYGLLAFFGGCLSLLLPETLNKKLPETIEEGNEFGRKTKDVHQIQENGEIQPLNKVDHKDIELTEKPEKEEINEKDTTNGTVPILES